MKLDTDMALSSIRQNLCGFCNLQNARKIHFFKRNVSHLSLLSGNRANLYECNYELKKNKVVSDITYKAVQLSQCRFYCSSPNEGPNFSKTQKRTLPQLMQFPETVWPSVLKSIKNWILINFIIRPYFDREFNLPDFIDGTKQALHVVSTKLSDGDLSTLTGLVASEAINEIKNVLTKMSVAQRTELRIDKEDIYFTFPYQVGIMFDESNENIQKRWVEITMVFHILRGRKDLQEKGTAPPINMGMLPEYRNRISICNYRFIKEFTQGIESDWTINVINHFKPADFIEE